jgi:flagellar biosynthesis/type III secretory pathway protein FliH
MRRQKIDPAVLAEIKDESAWEEAKELFKKEGRQSGLEEGREAGLKEGIEVGMEKGIEVGMEKGIEQGALAQQRRTALQARQMGMDAAAIAALVGLAEEDVEKILRTDQAV